MGKKARKRNNFSYNLDRKKLKKKMMRKSKPMIECPQIRKAWDNRKTAKQNLRDMGLAVGSKGVLPVNKAKDGPVDQTGLLKPYVIKEMEAEASLPTIDKTTCSNDMIEFLQHMIKEHNEDYKAMARDEKNYYQDTPKQIKRKVDLYKRCHPEEYATFIASLETGSSSGML
ncbi:nucleolar protein 16 [Electrophorus electricus]|uniref:Nucleolar protein 16 n=1 Tax=Electrophorus electricus TaxID=8005 RepID=A0AAY5F3Q2_ELEEL|nr:nucleolar protein 16 [Electrophorus electricus]